MNLSVRSITTPASTNVGHGMPGGSSINKPPNKNNYDIFQMNNKAMLGGSSDDNGSFQMVASGIGGNRGSRVKLIDNMSDAAMRKAMSEHVTQQANLSSAAKYNAYVEFEYKPTFLKQISGLWLLVAGRDPFAEIYSAHTMRRAKVLQTQGRVISAVGTKQYCIVGIANKEI